MSEFLTDENTIMVLRAQIVELDRQLLTTKSKLIYANEHIESLIRHYHDLEKAKLTIASIIKKGDGYDEMLNIIETHNTPDGVIVHVR